MIHARLYSHRGCPYSARARRILEEHGVTYSEAFPDSPQRRELVQKFQYERLPIIVLRRSDGRLPPSIVVRGSDKLRDALRVMGLRPLPPPRPR